MVRETIIIGWITCYSIKLEVMQLSAGYILCSCLIDTVNELYFHLQVENHIVCHLDRILGPS